MIIEPSITTHPKFVQLKSVVGDIAMEYLARLWGHCQQGKRGQFWQGAGPDYVEVICTGRSQRGKLFAALRDCQWIHETSNGVEIHDWNEHNASLIARWKRPPKGSAQTPAQPSGKRGAQTPAQGMEGSGGEGTGVDTTGGEGSGAATDPPRQTPTLAEAVDFFERNHAGYERHEVEAVYMSFEAVKRADGAWPWGNGRVTDWRMAMSSRLLDRYQKKIARGAEKSSGEPPAPAVKGSVMLADMRV